MDWIYELPLLNAFLNGTSTVFLVLGILAIKKGNRERHRIFMISAFVTSILFLASYLVYHFNVMSIPFTHTGPARYVYYVMLLTHVLLAMAVPFLAFGSLFLGAKMRFDSHKRLSRWTFPIWMYVSVTGVLIYLMLYQIYPSDALKDRGGPQTSISAFEN